MNHEKKNKKQHLTLCDSIGGHISFFINRVINRRRFGMAFRENWMANIHSCNDCGHLLCGLANQ